MSAFWSIVLCSFFFSLTSADNGFCTYIVEKEKYEPEIVSFLNPESVYEKCPGYYFKKCHQTRYRTRTKIEQKLIKTTELGKRCCSGYFSVDDDCIPYCPTNCPNGRCIAPNFCKCNDGYEMGKFSSECEPTCVGCEYGQCLNFNLCQCNNGYDWNEEKVKCVPNCTPPCGENSECSSPGVCTCHSGYQKTQNSMNLCLPHCHKICHRGTCIAPGICGCEEGFRLVNGTTNECEPICDIPCINSKCIDRNTCECHKNYEPKKEDTPYDCHCGKFCVEMDGACHCLDLLERVRDQRLYNDDPDLYCTPEKCKNGFCRTAYDCDCLGDFEKDENSNCVAVNETCIDDFCLSGSNSTKLEDHKCLCINGICSKENKCICINGYEKGDSSIIDKCIPQCDKKCIHGYCSEPNVCECDEGYRVSYESSTNDNGVCLPICDPFDDCINGTCIAPAICQCFEGFVLSETENFTCIWNPEALKQKSSSNILIWMLIILICLLASITAFVSYKKYFSNSYSPNYEEQNNSEVGLCEPNEEI